jgi:multidrug efflux pump subunit AcrB
MKQYRRGLIAWFARHTIAANLLMLLIMVGGVIGFNIVNKEVFPRFDLQKIDIIAAYPNASVLEIENSVCVRIEEAIYDVIGVKTLDSDIVDESCFIQVSLTDDANQENLINALRSKIQAITQLPKALETITVKPASRQGDSDDGVIWVALYADAAALDLQRYGDTLLDDFQRIEGVSLVRNYGEIPYQITIDIAPNVLKRYQLTLHDITLAIQAASLNQATGLIKSSAGELQLTVKNRAENKDDLRHLRIKSPVNGVELRLEDIATFHDGLAEQLSQWHHNGKNAQGWEIHAKRNAVDVAKRVKRYVSEKQKQFPKELHILTWWDDSQSYDERVNTLIEDGISGFLLVFIVLSLFLELRVAIWAGIGIFTSVLGALGMMAMLDVSLNMLSLFGFLLAMGILVDDAIIIGESVHVHQQMMKNKHTKEAYINATITGVKAVCSPVILSVLISLIAFLPGLSLPHWAGKMMQPICIVMILTLFFSLIEALLILPSHLTAPPRTNIGMDHGFSVWQNRLNQQLDDVVLRLYRPLLQWTIQWRYATVATFLVLLLLCFTWVQTGHIRLALQADVTKDNFWVSLKLPKDLPYSESQQRAKQIEEAFFHVRDEFNAVNPEQPSVVVGLETMIFEHGAGFWTELSATGREHILTQDFIDRWREKIGDLGTAKIDFLYKEGDVPYDISFDITSSQPEILQQVSDDVKAKLATYSGVFDIVDSSEVGKPELRLTLKKTASHLGLTLDMLSKQVSDAYYGDEVQRLQRGHNEVKVIVRSPLSTRKSLDDLHVLPIRLSNGEFTTLGTVADVHFVANPEKISRQNRHRVIKVQARVDPQKMDATKLSEMLNDNEFQRIRARYHDVDITLGQDYQEQQQTMQVLKQNTSVALFTIYCLIAVAFKSYTKPLLFLLAAPVAWCGAIIIHSIVGLPLSMESLVGMIAASGVVVNDSLVLLDYLEDENSEKQPLFERICNACTARFRPIFLAFMTNFAGFLPALLETSPQAQFLVPMTLSLSAGLLFGMLASLILTPVCYAIFEQ